MAHQSYFAAKDNENYGLPNESVPSTQNMSLGGHTLNQDMEHDAVSMLEENSQEDNEVSMSSDSEEDDFSFNTSNEANSSALPTSRVDASNDDADDLKKCALCLAETASSDLRDGHQIKSSSSSLPMSKVLVMTLQMSLRIRKTWEICEQCITKLEAADVHLKQFNDCKKKMVDVRQDMLEMIKPRLKMMRNNAKRQNLVRQQQEVLKHQEIQKEVKKQQVMRSLPPYRSPLSVSLTVSERKEKIPCPLCLKVVTKKTLKDHVPRQHTKEIPIICKKCVKQLPNEKDFANHMLSYHKGSTIEDIAYDSDIEKGITKKKGTAPKVKIKVNCPECKVLISKPHLKEHMNVHEQKYVHKCRECPEMFMTKSRKILHMRRFHGHPDPTKRQHICEYCNKIFQGKASYTQHVKIVHSQTKDFKCEYCDAAFKIKQQLILHRRKHTDERPFICKVCNQRFRRSASCRKHIKRVHKIEISQLRLNDPVHGRLLPMEKVMTTGFENQQVQIPTPEVHIIQEVPQQHIPEIQPQQEIQIQQVAMPQVHSQIHHAPMHHHIVPQHHVHNMMTTHVVGMHVSMG